MFGRAIWDKLPGCIFENFAIAQIKRGRAIWDKLPGCSFENFEIAQVKRGQFQNFKNHEDDLSQKSLKRNMWLLVNHTKSTNTLY